MPKSKQFDPVDLTPEEAFEILQAMPEGERTMVGLSKEIKKQLGKDVSRSVLMTWRTRHLWDGKIILASRKFTGTAPAMLEMMRVCAEGMGHEALNGLMGQMLAKIGANIDALECKDMTAMAGMLSLIERTISLRNQFAGKTAPDDDEDDPPLGEVPVPGRPH